MDKSTYLTTPNIARGNLNISLESILFEKRIIMFQYDVNMESCSALQTALLTLDEMEYKGRKHEDIYLYINSYGGSLYALLGIYDAMQHIRSDVATICTGVAMSAGAIMLMAGAKGKRYALPHSRIMFHEIRCGIPHSKHSDFNVDARENNDIAELYYNIIIKHIKKDEAGNVPGLGGDPHAKTVEEVRPEAMFPDHAKEWLKNWMELDRFLNPQQALNMGFIDSIIETKHMPHYVLGDKKE